MKQAARFLLAAALLAVALAAAADEACEACGGELGGRHWQLDERLYCSEACARTTLPRCHACASPVDRGLRIEGRSYCEPHGAAPACSSCGFPAVDDTRLADGRRLCGPCERSCIDTRTEAERSYRRAARAVEEITGLPLGRLPRLELLSQHELIRAGGGLLDENSLGLYRTDRRWETTDGRRSGPIELRNARVSLLTHLVPGEFEAAAVHELTHHLLVQHHARVEDHGPLWLSEGVAEYVAAIAARDAGRHELAAAMRRKDPPYGTGLRWLQRRFGEDDWPALRRWLTRTDPRRLPASPQ